MRWLLLSLALASCAATTGSPWIYSCVIPDTNPKTRCYRKLANQLDDYLSANHDSIKGTKRAEIIGAIETLRQAAAQAGARQALIELYAGDRLDLTVCGEFLIVLTPGEECPAPPEIRTDWDIQLHDWRRSNAKVEVE